MASDGIFLRGMPQSRARCLLLLLYVSLLAGCATAGAPHTPSADNVAAHVTVMPGAAAPCTQASHIIVADSNSSYFAVSGEDGSIVFGAETADQTVNAAIAALPRNGGTLAFRPGVFALAAPITIDRNSVTLLGANAGGDLFFTSMDNGTQGFDDKVATVLLAAGDFDAVAIGTADALIFGAAVTDLGISGVASNMPLPRPVKSGGAGIHVQQCDTVDIRHVDVRRKAFGVLFDKKATQPMPWNVADVLTLHNIYLSYNGWGVYIDGWLGNAKISNVYSYLNELGVLYKSGSVGQYDFDLTPSQARLTGGTAPLRHSTLLVAKT